MKTLILTLLWTIPMVFALSNILNYYHFGMTMRCLYFSLGVLGYLITRKLID